jgi:hypothetical protein
MMFMKAHHTVVLYKEYKVYTISFQHTISEAAKGRGRGVHLVYVAITSFTTFS